MRVQFFQLLQSTVRVATNSPEKVSQFLLDHGPSDVLMRDAELIEIVVVKEMTKRAVADIVQQRRHAQQAFDIRARRNISTRFAQRFGPVIDRYGRQMHGTKNMLKPHVFGGGKDPPGGLKLMNMSHPLHPGMINNVLLRGFV